MGTHTQLNETRTVLRDADGNQIYRIELECIDEGPLNDTGLFVFQIFNTRNPLGDIFQRVAEVTDLEDYLNNRDDAVIAGAEYWRNSVHTLEYDDIDTANAAVRTISDRVNTLVKDYTSYKTEFETDPSPETTSYPVAEDTVIDERKADYEEAVDDYNTALAAEAVALTARDEAQDDLDAANSDLLEWQIQQDKVCGGNTSEQGNEVGLEPGMDSTGNAFLELLDGSGSFVWDTNSTAFRDNVQAFYDEATEIISGNGTSAFFRCTVDVSVPADATDLGKEVTDGTYSGYLTAISTVDSSTQYWWVGNADSNISGSVTITGGVGVGSISSIDIGNRPYETLLSDLNTALINMDSTLTSAEAYKTPTEETILDHVDTCNETQTIAGEKLDTANTASDALKESEATYVAAQGATQAAYDNVIDAYDAVKEVCPDWSPDPPLPAKP